MNNDLSSMIEEIKLKMEAMQMTISKMHYDRDLAIKNSVRRCLDDVINIVCIQASQNCIKNSVCDGNSDSFALIQNKRRPNCKYLQIITRGSVAALFSGLFLKALYNLATYGALGGEIDERLVHYIFLKHFTN